MAMWIEENCICKVATVEDFNSQGAAATETVLYTVPTGKKFYPMFVLMNEITASMATCVVTFGKGGGACDEFRGDVTLTYLNGTTKYAIIHMQNATRNIPDGGVVLTAGQSFSIEVTTADADGGYADIDVFGILKNA